MRMTLCAAGALWLLASPLGAQAPTSSPAVRLTLAEARTMAQRTSPELTAARQALAAAQARERQVGAFPNPTLTYGREQTARDGATNSQNMLTLEQRFEIGGQRGARREAVGLQRAAAGARLAAAKARVNYEVALSYATAVAAERRAVLAEEAARAFGTAERVSTARFAGGDVSGYQHRRLKLESSRYTALRLEALVARDSAMHVLASLIGNVDSVPQGHAFQLVDTLLPAPLTLSSDSFVARALAERGELRSARFDADAGIAEARLAAAERIPTPAVSGGFKNERLATGEGFSGFAVGLSVPLPLWDRRGGAVAAAHAEAGRRAADVESLRRQTIREVRTAFDTHQALAEQLATLAGQLGDEARKARRAAEAAYSEGEISLLEWLDSVRAYQEAETVYITLWSEYIARRARTRHRRHALLRNACDAFTHRL
jgi:cobalt-zinc-cadmium efflux system outer membrane protein